MSLATEFAGVTATTLVANRLNEFFAERIAHAEMRGESYRRLWAAARDACDGGKRFRPAFVIGVHRAFGGTDIDSAVAVAAAFELLHTAFLMHDDVIDADTVRRGRPNLVGAFAADARSRGVTDAAAKRWGNSAAIIAGDLLIHEAQALVARLPLADPARSALLDLLVESMFATAAGELDDVAFAVGVHAPRLAEVLSMSESKTADYSFASPLKAGGILAGADPVALDVLGEYGRLVGVAFQLRDDVLGVFGEEAITGKSIVSDLREGKVTPLIAYARTTPAWRALGFGDVERPFRDEDARLLRETLESCGARSFVENVIRDHVDRAVAVVATADLPGGLGARLCDAALQAAERVV